MRGLKNGEILIIETHVFDIREAIVIIGVCLREWIYLFLKSTFLLSIIIIIIGRFLPLNSIFKSYPIFPQ